jgi:hypothetical protein
MKPLAALLFVLAWAGPVAAQPKFFCEPSDITIGNVQVFQSFVHVFWTVRKPCPIDRSGLLLGRSPTALRFIVWARAQSDVYETTVSLHMPVEDAWIGAFVIDTEGSMIASAPRRVAGALVTAGPTVLQQRHEDGHCRRVRVRLGVAPVLVDGAVAASWGFDPLPWSTPCKLIETGILMGPTPLALAKAAPARAAPGQHEF